MRPQNSAKQMLAAGLKALISKNLLLEPPVHLGFPGFLDIGDIAAAADRLVPARLFLQTPAGRQMLSIEVSKLQLLLHWPVHFMSRCLQEPMTAAESWR